MPLVQDVSVVKKHKTLKWLVTLIYALTALPLLPVFLGELFGFGDTVSMLRETNDVGAIILPLFFFISPILLIGAIIMMWRKSLSWALLGTPVYIAALIMLIAINRNIDAAKLEAQQRSYQTGDILG